MHITLSEQVKEGIRAYAKARSPMSMSAVLRKAAESFLSLESMDPAKEAALKTAISRWLNLPDIIPTNTAYVFLYMFYSTPAYAKAPAKSFWQVLYIASIEKTHRELYLEVKAEADSVLERSRRASQNGSSQ